MRRALAVLLLAVLAGSAGCSTILGPGSPDAGSLAENASYDWDRQRAAYLEVNRDNYTAVYAVANRTTGDREAADPTVELYTHDVLGTEQPLEVSAVQFRYPNGTHVSFRESGDTAVAEVRYPNGSTSTEPGALTVNRTRRRTVVHLPANETGKLAFTTPKNGKQVSTPTFVRGDYEMVLPRNTDVSVPLLGQVRPPRDEARTVDGRVHVVWRDVGASTVSVRYYLDRDLLLFAALVGGLTLTGITGAVYYLRQIRATRKRREEVGLDVDVEDDDREGPPPGMR